MTPNKVNSTNNWFFLSLATPLAVKFRFSKLKGVAPTRGPTSTLNTAQTQQADSSSVLPIYVGLFWVVLSSSELLWVALSYSETFWTVFSYTALFWVVFSYSELFWVRYEEEGKILSTGIQMLIIHSEFWSSWLVCIGYTQTILAWTQGVVFQFRLAINRRWARLFKYLP